MCECKVKKVPITKTLTDVTNFKYRDVIEYCPLHKAAPEMLEALKGMILLYKNTGQTIGDVIVALPSKVINANQAIKNATK